MKKIIITAIVVIVAIGALILIAKTYSGSNKTGGSVSKFNGVLTAEESSFDFGTISMAKGKVSHMFKIKNTSNETANIEKMYTSCMCTVASLIKGDKKFGPFGMPGHTFIAKINQVVNAGEEASVEVVYDPAAHGPAGIGKIQRGVTLENGSSNLELNFSAFVTP